MKKVIADTVVIGGGASGLFAAAQAALRGQKTYLFEHGEYTGRKLRITGKGRCNVTNHASPREIMENLPTNGKFLFSALNAFPPSEVMALFEGLGVPLKTERGRRVFPVSDQASDIVDALRRYCRRGGVETVFTAACSVGAEGDSVTGVMTEKGFMEADNVLLATGGVSYPLTGSTGDGYRMAEALGHTVTPLRASLVPLETEGELCPSMQGLSLKNVVLSVFDPKGKKLYEELGEMLFTHFGVSGPLVLSASAHIRDWSKGTYRGKIDLKPALDEKKLDERIQRELRENANKDFLNAIRGLMPAKMIPVMARFCEIPGETKANSVTKTQRQALVSALKGLPITFTGTRSIDEAIITSGGIRVREVNPSTMESKLVRGLYFAGEILDVDGYTGGYNLQVAWSTARAAGLHIGERDK